MQAHYVWPLLENLIISLPKGQMVTKILTIVTANNSQNSSQSEINPFFCTGQGTIKPDTGGLNLLFVGKAWTYS